MSDPTYSGKMIFRVRFDKQVSVPADGGGVQTDWLPQFTRWSDIRPMRGGEGIQAQRLVGTQPALLIVMADSSTKQIDPSWRAVELKNNQPVHYYAIKTAADMERKNKYITMVVVEGDPDS